MLAALLIGTNSFICLLGTLKESRKGWEFLMLDKKRKASEHYLRPFQTTLIDRFDRKEITLKCTDALKLFSCIHLPMYIIELAVLLIETN